MSSKESEQIKLDTNAPGFNRFASAYWKLPAKPETTFRVFDRTDFYTVHDQDALFAAREVFKTMSVVKYFGSGASKLASVALSKTNFEAVLRDLLLVRHYRVEIYKCKAKTNEWTLAYKASPGNLQQFEDVLFGSVDMSLSSGALAVNVGSKDMARVVGVAYVDVSLRKMHVCEFVDNEQFSNFEATIIQLGPKECIIPHVSSQSTESNKLKQVAERNGLLVSEKKKVDYHTKDIIQDMNRLLKLSSGSAATLSEMELHVAMSSLSALIKYLELLSDESNFGQFTLQMFDLSQYMRLDASAVHALGLLPHPADRGNKNVSLYGLLNKCKTAQGQRLLYQWVKQPLTDKNKIEERLNLVEVLVDDTGLRLNLQDEHLKRYPDFYRLAKRLQRQRANLQDCVKVYQGLSRLPVVVAALENYSGKYSCLVHEVFVGELKELCEDFQKYLDLVETTVDLTQVENHEFLIKPEFDESLQDTRDKMDDIASKMPSVLNKDEKSLRGNKSFTSIDTNARGVRFTCSSLRQLNDEFLRLRESYNELQSHLAAEVIKVAAGYCDPLQSLNDIIAHLDVLVSFAHVAANAPIPYVRPTILEKGSGIIDIKGSRHACLEVQDNISFISNDATFNKKERMFHLITGPNMGGKSTYIRQVGVVVLMAQLGSYVPCWEATITIVDSILARVGASDSQLRGISTFMAEMLETASILKSATMDSLIIIDELGRGTSTYDGFGLAWAVSEYISTKLQAFGMFATHFHELTELAQVVPCVVNSHVTAMTTDSTLTLLYKVKPGACDRSFGIHVAELAHFPSHVIQFAKQKAEDLEGTHGFWDVADDAVPAAKRQKTEKEEGLEIIRDFLDKVKVCVQSCNAETDFGKEMLKLKDEVLDSQNSFIRFLLKGHSV
ncbi:DNA mismatch repair protein Msh2-like isoform X2 [Corticium candelabrum]|uniref:DNA mismatch repair protein Msh2-like isoform X2 n=1 Tax=Corticium candelabrum TaxID=121492 RepID=UPI002E25AECA|nr:DNA mismatch repair protein Msh2-like isoform X2 [Corticium candelabrum]